MKTIEDQLELEKEMMDLGAERYLRSQQALVDAGSASGTAAGRKIVNQSIPALVAALDEKFNPTGRGFRAAAVRLLRNYDPYKAAMISIKTMLDRVQTQPTLTSVARAIGQRVEDDMHFHKFEEEHKDYYSRVIEQFKANNTTSYRHRHRVLNHLATQNDVEWNNWTADEQVQVGALLIDMVLNETDLFYTNLVRMAGNNHRQYIIEMTDECMQWMEDDNQIHSLMCPERLPLIVSPAEWTTLYDGGYYSPLVRKRTSLVKTNSKAHRRFLEANMDDTTIRATVNKIQATPWAINTEVLDVMKNVWRLSLGTGMPQSEPYTIPDCPMVPGWSADTGTEDECAIFDRWKREAAMAHKAERDRRGKCFSYTRGMQLASRYADSTEFYFTYQADFRGRLYCATPILSPQGADHAKGLLSFATRKPVGSRGGYWMAVQGANVFGEDKVSFDDRVQWVDDNINSIISVYRNPLGSDERSFWGDADKPWQFLQFCLEFARYHLAGRPTTFETAMHCALDGSCNGLQHFSGMLRDHIGGAYTNLTASSVPSDIYKRVAEVTADLLEECITEDPDDIFAQQWLAAKFDRKLTKRPVMTLPYGATRTSCREYCEDWIYDNLEKCDKFWPEAIDKFRASFYLHSIVWKAMSMTLVASMEAMTWLQVNSREVSRRNEFLNWTAPNGFVVYQAAYQRDSHEVSTQLMGRTRLNVQYDTTDINGRKQATSVAPNFVHSYDAAHMYLTILDFTGADLWLVHDSYATHVCDTEVLATSIRTTFVGMYQDTDPLQEFKESNNITCESMPMHGDLDINSVLSSPYFFA